MDGLISGHGVSDPLGGLMFRYRSPFKGGGGNSGKV